MAAATAVRISSPGGQQWGGSAWGPLEKTALSGYGKDDAVGHPELAPHSLPELADTDVVRHRSEPVVKELGVGDRLANAGDDRQQMLGPSEGRFLGSGSNKRDRGRHWQQGHLPPSGLMEKALSQPVKPAAEEAEEGEWIPPRLHELRRRNRAMMQALHRPPRPQVPAGVLLQGQRVMPHARLPGLPATNAGSFHVAGPLAADAGMGPWPRDNWEAGGVLDRRDARRGGASRKKSRRHTPGGAGSFWGQAVLRGGEAASGLTVSGGPSSRASIPPGVVAFPGWGRSAVPLGGQAAGAVGGVSWGMRRGRGGSAAGRGSQSQRKPWGGEGPISTHPRLDTRPRRLQAVAPTWTEPGLPAVPAVTAGAEAPALPGAGKGPKSRKRKRRSRRDDHDGRWARKRGRRRGGHRGHADSQPLDGGGDVVPAHGTKEDGFGLPQGGGLQDPWQHSSPLAPVPWGTPGSDHQMREVMEELQVNPYGSMNGCLRLDVVPYSGSSGDSGSGSSGGYSSHGSQGSSAGGAMEDSEKEGGQSQGSSESWGWYPERQAGELEGGPAEDGEHDEDVTTPCGDVNPETRRSTSGPESGDGVSPGGVDGAAGLGGEAKTRLRSSPKSSPGSLQTPRSGARRGDCAPSGKGSSSIATGHEATEPSRSSSSNGVDFSRRRDAQNPDQQVEDGTWPHAQVKGGEVGLEENAVRSEDSGQANAQGDAAKGQGDTLLMQLKRHPPKNGVLPSTQAKLELHREQHHGRRRSKNGLQAATAEAQQQQQQQQQRRQRYNLLLLSPNKQLGGAHLNQGTAGALGAGLHGQSQPLLGAGRGAAGAVGPFRGLGADGASADAFMRERLDEQDTQIARLEEENLTLRERLFVAQQELLELRRRVAGLHGWGSGAEEEEGMMLLMEAEADNNYSGHLRGVGRDKDRDSQRGIMHVEESCAGGAALGGEGPGDSDDEEGCDGPGHGNLGPGGNSSGS